MGDFGYGFLFPYHTTSRLGELAFIFKSLAARLNTMKLVRVVAVYNIGGLSPTGQVDVQPLVSQVDGNNNAYPHGTVSGIQYFRLQGGVNAVICDPAVGDVGYVVCADRDSTNVKLGQSSPVSPGSFRRFDLQDGVYVGGVLNATPKQYVQFTSTGIVVADQNGNSLTFGPGGITVVGNLIVENNLQLAGNITSASGSTYSGNITTTGSVSASGEITALAGASSVTLGTHKHSGVTTGAGQSGAPVGGT